MSGSEAAGAKKPTVFIQTNARQRVGAIVARHALRRNSKRADDFDVELLDVADHPFFLEYEGREFLRGGGWRPWRNDDLQSFTPLRFMPPEAMGYQGRAVVIDPDCFAVGDVWELLGRDMQGKAILCRARTGDKGRSGCMATSVMLLDCAQLQHWRVREQFDAMFRGELDYLDWTCLHDEPRDSLGLLENAWNDFDHLDEATKILHTTKRRTQPWKTGLPADYIPAEKMRWFPPAVWLQRARRRVLGDYALLPPYKEHPDPNQESLFFGLLRECLETGQISEKELRDEMSRNHVRHDAFAVLERSQPLPA